MLHCILDFLFPACNDCEEPGKQPTGRLFNFTAYILFCHGRFESFVFTDGGGMDGELVGWDTKLGFNKKARGYIV